MRYTIDERRRQQMNKTNKKLSLSLRKAVEAMSDRPEYGKVYSLTGGIGTKCIAQGYSWKESEYKEVK